MPGAAFPARRFPERGVSVRRIGESEASGRTGCSHGGHSFSSLRLRGSDADRVRSLRLWSFTQLCVARARARVAGLSFFRVFGSFVLGLWFSQSLRSVITGGRARGPPLRLARVPFLVQLPAMRFSSECLSLELARPPLWSVLWRSVFVPLGLISFPCRMLWGVAREFEIDLSLRLSAFSSVLPSFGVIVVSFAMLRCHHRSPQRSTGQTVDAKQLTLARHPPA